MLGRHALAGIVAPSLVIVLVVGLSVLGCQAGDADENACEDSGPLVMAAASTTRPLVAIGEAWSAESGYPRPRLSFGASGRLAAQLDAGARADVVVMADAAWMDHVVARGHVAGGSRVDIARNDLVVVAPRSRSDAPGTLDEMVGRRVAIAADAAPVGRRAREALTALGLWERVSPTMVVTASAPLTLAPAALGEVDAAVVYGSAAATSSAVRVIYRFSPHVHAPIVYPAGLSPVGEGCAAARSFHTFLQGREAASIFAHYGFSALESASGVDHPARADTFVSPGGSARGQVSGVLWLSVQVALFAVLLSLLPAIGFAWLLARRHFFGKALLSTFLMGPLVLPPVVTGYVLLLLFGRSGVFGGVLEALGWQIVFTRWAAVLAAAVVGFPLLVLMSRLAIEAVDPRYEALAHTLGDTPLRAFIRVTLPMALPGIVAGAVLGFARMLGEFGATAVVAGDVPGETRTLSLAVYALAQEPGGEAAAGTLVGVSLGLALVALVGYEWLTRVQRRRLLGDVVGARAARRDGSHTSECSEEAAGGAGVGGGDGDA